jgi:ABC-2 type transport system ATP-binding protein
MLDVLGIGDRAHEPVTAFSKGMRQKVVLAAALLPDPQVLVLDEPLAGLDAETTQLAKELLALETSRGRAILYCSHLLDIVEKVADRIAILTAGRLVTVGSLEELLDQPSLEAVFRHITDAVDPATQARRLLEG